MSQEIDEKVVELVLDNKQFESNATQSIHTMDKLNDSMQMKGVDKGFDRINAAVKNSNIPLLGEAVEQVGLKFSMMYSIADQAVRNITTKVQNAATRIISALTIDPVKMGFSEYETKINAIQTIMSNTASKGTTMSDVTKVINELNTYADKTIYNFAEMTKNIGTFTAAGVGLEDSAAAIQGIANLAAASGSNSQQASTAMYQLSQALSTGTVRLMDWNSVVNAGMGGEKFQNALKDTAREMGVSIDSIVKKAGSFRESLSDGWLTADILNTTLRKFTKEGAAEYAKSMQESGKYTQEQADALLKEAQAMEDAATKVKTFTQLWSTVQESIQSGWGQTWEIIIGDFEEAKEQLSDFSAKIGYVIEEVSNFRNDMLGSGLSSGWKQLTNQGITNEEDFISVLKTEAKKSGVAIDDIIEKYDGDFKKALKDGWLTTDMLADGISKYTKNLSGMSTESLKASGYTSEQVDAIKNLNEKIQKGTLNLDEFITKINRPSGAENLFDALNNTFDALLSYITPVAKAFNEIFFKGKNMGEVIYSISESLKEFTKGLILGEEASNNLKRTFKGLFAVVDIVWELFKAIFTNVIDPLLGGVVDLSGGILGLTGSFGDWLVALRDAIEASDFFNVTFKKVGEVVKYVWDFIKGTILGPSWEVLSAFLEVLGIRFENVGDVAAGVAPTIKEFFYSITEFIEKYDIIGFLKKLGDGIKSFAQGAGSKIAEFLKSIDYDLVLDFFNTLIHGGFLAAIGVFVGSITKAVDTLTKETKKGGIFGKIGNKICGVLDQTKAAIKDWQKQIKANTIKTIAISIAILAAALLVLSFIDSKKLFAATAAITALFVNLMVAMKIITGLDITDDKLSGIQKLMKMAGGMVVFATAALILAAAAAILGKLDWQGLAKGLIGVSVLLASIALFIKFGAANVDGIFKTASGIVVLAAGIVILAAACKIFATMSWNDLSKGLTATIVLLGAVMGFGIGISRLTKGKSSLAVAAASMLIVAGAMAALAASMLIFNNVEWSSVGKAVTTLGIIMGALVGVGAIAKTFKGSLATSAASFTVVAVALAGLAGALLLFNKVDWSDIDEVGIALAGIMTAMVGAGFLSKSFKGSLLAAAGSVSILAIGLAAMAGALMLYDGVNWESFSKAAASLGALMGMMIGFGALTKFLATWGVIATAGTLIVLAVGLAALAGSIMLFDNVSWESFGKACASLGALMGILAAFGGLLAGLTYAAGAGAIMLGMMAGIAIIIPLFAGGLMLMAEAIKRFEDVNWGAFGKAAAMLSIFILGIMLVASGAMSAGIALGALALPLLQLAAAIALFALAIKLLEHVDIESLGNSVAGLITIFKEHIPGIAEAILSCIDQVLAQLVAYTPSIIKHIGEFILGVLDGLIIYTPQIVTKLLELLAVVLDSLADALSNISLIDIGITSLIFGAIYAVIYGLNLLGPLIPGAIGAIAGLAILVVEIGLILAALGGLAQIPGLEWIISEGGDLLGTIGTALGKFVGGLAGGIAAGFTDSLPEIASDLSAFMVNLKPFIEGINLIDPTAAEGAKHLSAVILALTGASIMDGLTSWFTGGVSLTAFGQELAAFGPYFKQYHDAVAGIDGSVVQASASAAMTLVEFANAIPNSGGLWGLIAGENSISEFAKELAAFGPYFKKYADSVAGIDPTVVQASASAALCLAELANKLPNSGGLAALLAGDNTLSDFGSQIVSLGKSVKKFSDSVSGINVAQMNAVLVSIGLLCNMLEKVSDGVFGGVTGFCNAIEKMGKAGIDTFVDAFDSAADRVKKAGKNVIKFFLNGVDEKSDDVDDTFEDIADSGVSTIEDQYQDYKDAGSYLASGLSSGISSKTSSVMEKAKNLANQAAAAIRAALIIKSPSRVTYKLGEFTGEGFVNALSDYGSEAYGAGSVMADSARKGLGAAINSIKKMIDNGIDAQPTIRPVMDLSDVRSGANAISGMLNMGSSIGVSANVGAISTMMRSHSQNGGNSDVISAINKLRDSLANTGNTTYTINGVTYDDGSNIADAVQSIVRAARVERRV